MKAIAIAIGLCFIAAAAVFGLAYPLTKSAEMAYGVAGLPFVVCHHIAEVIEQQEARRHFSLGKPISANSQNGFAISWPLITIFGAIIIAVLSQAIGFLVGGIIAGASDKTAAFRSAAIFFYVPALMLLGFFVGRWIGARCRSHGIVALLMMAFFSSLVGHAFDYAVMTHEQFHVAFGEDKSIGFFLLQLADTFILLVPALLLGYWRGSRHRIYKYLEFLLAIVPTETRAVFIDLAIQEANSASLKKARA